MNVQEILKYITDKEIYDLHELIEVLYISESTIRRRIKTLEQLGYIKLLRGGKIKIINQKQVSILDEYKIELNKFNKISIAKEAVKHILDDEVIFIDNGTTIRYMLEFLQGKNIIIYTNGFKHLEYVRSKNLDLDIRLIPGKIRLKEGAIVGEEAIVFLDNLLLDKVFIGANGIDVNFGITTPNEDEKNLKYFALQKALTSYVLIDQSKRGIISKYKICNEHDVNVISY